MASFCSSFGLCFLLVVVNLVVNTSAITCMARLYTMICYVSNGTLNTTNYVTHSDLISPNESL